VGGGEIASVSISTRADYEVKLCETVEDMEVAFQKAASGNED
jgi:hypothetical protein